MFTPLVQSDCFEVQYAFGKFLSLSSTDTGIEPKYWVHEYYIVFKAFYNVTTNAMVLSLCFNITLSYSWAAHYMHDFYFWNW